MLLPSSSVNMERLKDGNVELCRLFTVINKFLTIKENKEIKAKKNIEKISG